MQYFKQLPIHSVFDLNGTIWVKQSTRTAHIWGNPDRWFYFGMNEVVKQDHSK
jgi:hypothetical protein